MRIALCVDDKNGYAFNHRRQSRDQVLYNHLAHIADGKLMMAPYSHRQCPDLSVAYCGEDFLEVARAKNGLQSFISEPSR